MEKLKTKKSLLEISFRPQYLLPTDRFISYCRDNGIFISKKNLEELHKEGLLYPAVKVYRGTVKLKKIYADFQGKKEWRFVDPKDVKKFKPTKIAKKKWYISGGFSMGKEDWLDWYIKRKMAEYPISQKFTSWDKKTSKYYTDKSADVENCYELFYEKLQLIALKIIIGRIKIWKNLDESQKKQSKKWIKKELTKLYKFLKLYIEIEKFRKKWIKIKSKEIKENKEKGLTLKQIKNDWQDILDIDYKPILKTTAQEILKKYRVTLKYIKDWRYFLVQQNIFYEAPRSSSCIRTYLKGMDENFLIKAEDVNYMIYVINFFIYALTNKEFSVKQIISNTEIEYCKICGIAFSLKRKGQITCGDPYCVNENKNKLKRQKRILNNT